MYRHIWTMELNDPANAEPFKEHWRAVSEILQQYPGALGSHLHRVTSGPVHFLMIGDWASEEARRKMSHDIHNGDSELARRWRVLPSDETFGTVVRLPCVEVEAVVIDNK